MPVYEAAQTFRPTHCSAFEFTLSGKDRRHTAFIDASSDARLSVGELETYALRFAWSIRNLWHVRATPDLLRGDRLLLFSSNHLLYPALMYGALAAGTPIALVPSSQAAKEVAHAISITKPKLVIVGAGQLEVFLEAARLLKWSSVETSCRSVILVDDGSVPDSVLDGWDIVGSWLEVPTPDFVPEKFDGEAAKLVRLSSNVCQAGRCYF